MKEVLNKQICSLEMPTIFQEVAEKDISSKEKKLCYFLRKKIPKLRSRGKFRVLSCAGLDLAFYWLSYFIGL